MGSINISYLDVFLIFAGGGLIVGLPLYLTTIYAHGGIPYRFTLTVSTVSFFIGVYLIGIALKLPVFVILYTAIIGSIAALVGIIIGLRRIR
jgi:hypothetical protein